MIIFDLIRNVLKRNPDLKEYTSHGIQLELFSQKILCSED